MKVLLVEPRNNELNKLPPLRILYTASYLREKGIKVEIIDLNTETEKKLLKEIKNYEPGIIGFNCNEKQINGLRPLIKQVKKQGSLTVALTNETGIKQGQLTLFDSVIAGDPEKAFYKYAKKPRKGLINAGLNYKLDSLPMPAIEMVNLKKYKPLINLKKPVSSIITSRGSLKEYDPETRIFSEETLRYRSAKKIIEEIEQQLSKGVGELCFTDECFGHNTKLVNELCNLMIDKKINLKWQCPKGLVINNLDESLIERMKLAGCYNLTINFPSGNQSTIKRLRKKFDLDHAQQVINWCNKLGLITSARFTIGYSFETTGSLKRTNSFIEGLKADLIIINQLKNGLKIKINNRLKLISKAGLKYLLKTSFS